MSPIFVGISWDPTDSEAPEDLKAAVLRTKKILLMKAGAATGSYDEEQRVAKGASIGNLEMDDDMHNDLPWSYTDGLITVSADSPPRL